MNKKRGKAHPVTSCHVVRSASYGFLLSDMHRASFRKHFAMKKQPKSLLRSIRGAIR